MFLMAYICNFSFLMFYDFDLFDLDMFDFDMFDFDMFINVYVILYYWSLSYIYIWKEKMLSVPTTLNIKYDANGNFDSRPSALPATLIPAGVNA